MYKGRRIAVVIPAYRAEATIGEVVRGLPEFVDHIVVVEDASPDQTSAAVEALADPRIRLVRNPRNRGVGGAMKEGLKEVLKLGADIAVKVDADGQMSPAFMPCLLDALCDEGFHYGKGNRFYDRAALAAMPRLRLLGNIVGSYLTKLASGYWTVFDSQNGYIALTRAVLERLDIDRLDERYFFENSLLIQLNVLDVPVADVPMPAHYAGEISSLRPGRLLSYYPRRLVSGLAYRLWNKHFLMHTSPVALLLASGAPLMLFGTAFGLYHWWRSIATGVPATTGTVMLAVLPFILGAQFLLQALLMDVASAPRASIIARLGDGGQEATQGTATSEENPRPQTDEPR
jgi:glycosyltransferase involved in cell wall biosynthesis